MQRVTRIILAGTLLAASTGAFAGSRDDAALEACTSRLQQLYGAGTEVKLVKSRRAPGGLQMQLATQVDADNSRFSTCRVGRDGVAALLDEEPEQLLAAVPVVPSEPDPR